MYILNGVCTVDKNNTLSKEGYLKYDNETLEYWKYKGFPGRYDLVMYIIIKIITLFLKDKLVLSIKKNDIQSIKIEIGEEIGGISGRLMKFGGTNKMPDTFIVTTKDGSEHRWIIGGQVRKKEDNSTFNDLAANMEIELS